MSSPVGWLPLVFTTLAGGAVGSLIATYGSQARDRRAARSEAMASIQRFELARGRKTRHKIFEVDEDDLVEVETRCLLAGIPRYLVDLYKLLNESMSSCREDRSDLDSPINEVEALQVLVTHEAIRHVVGLLASAVWHPWLTAPSRRWRARRLRRLFFRRQPNNRRFRSLHNYLLEVMELKRDRVQPLSSQLPGSDQP